LDQNDVPRVYQEFQDAWEKDRQSPLHAYQTHQHSFVPNLLPEQAVRLTAGDTLNILRQRFGQAVDLALQHGNPADGPSIVPKPIRSPVAHEPDGRWLRLSNMVGINVRTIGSFWNVVKYALTISEAQDSIHLLPVWEPGVVGSLYGISSWQINSEFFSEEFAQACPQLDTVEKQLKTVVNLLHVMGRAVGMDVIPHTDRFSEITLAQPHYFEWLQRENTEIVDHSENLHERVQDIIMDFLAANGPAVPGEPIPSTSSAFFSNAFPEAQRLTILFGLPEDREQRAERRNQLVKYLNAYGFEPVPATMAPPFRGLTIDPDSKYVDSRGNTWYDFSITHPQAMSRVFNPLARYKLYGRLNDNIDWEIDFENPRREVWLYICERYCEFQQRYGFDFMRGDMSHVQMRPEGVPRVIDDCYDILRAVKNYIQQEKGVHHFGYFAETFLAPRNIMVYGDEVDHLDMSDADATLGDLQSTSIGSAEFLQRFRQYRDLLTTRSFAPSFTVITGDKDDPRFDKYYLKGNELRLFIACFLTDMPSYMSLGFETRDTHHKPAPNECYTKLYVFQEKSGPKATAGPFTWGKNGALYHIVTRLRLYIDTMFSTIRGQPCLWLIHPDPTGEQKHIVWTQKNHRPTHVFVANTDTQHPVCNFNIPHIMGVEEDEPLQFEFSTAQRVVETDLVLTYQGKGYRVTQLAPGEGRVYNVVRRNAVYADPLSARRQTEVRTC
jgi:hypothetical protein